mmetsp:Transcript_9511/g.13266  ORF Transcript_9511/g.13266 Transcript_9511/m.13266 type:complete len:82 (-) Transcript_9511:32-277(-)
MSAKISRGLFLLLGIYKLNVWHLDPKIHPMHTKPKHLEFMPSSSTTIMMIIIAIRNILFCILIRQINRKYKKGKHKHKEEE